MSAEEPLFGQFTSGNGMLPVGSVHMMKSLVCYLIHEYPFLCDSFLIYMSSISMAHYALIY